MNFGAYKKKNTLTLKDLGVFKIIRGRTYNKELWPVKNTVGVYSKGPRPVNNTVV